MISGEMTSVDRVMKALNFEEPDRVPRYDSFWPEFTEKWRLKKAPATDPIDYYGIDMVVVEPDESIWPSGKQILERSGNSYLERTGWGNVYRRVKGQQLFEEIEPGISERVDPDKLEFEDPLQDTRYEQAGLRTKTYSEKSLAIFGKTGGPFLRAAHLRGMENFLLDIFDDPGWVVAFVERIVEHLIQIGTEQIRKFGLENTGIGIFDDIAATNGLIMGLESYQKLFYPSLQKMVRAYKDAGAAKVFHHCDGYVGDVLDLWVEAGIDAVNPLEFRAGLDPVRTRDKYDGKLAVIGGVDNCDILPRGSREEVFDHVLHVLEAGQGGGLVISAHSIGPDISVDTYDYYSQLCKKHGRYPICSV